MAKQLLYYYTWDKVNNKPVIYDMQVYRGSVSAFNFTGAPYAIILGSYEQYTGKTMMHSTGTMDNWKQV